MTLYRLAYMHKCFRGAYCLHSQGNVIRVTGLTWRWWQQAPLKQCCSHINLGSIVCLKARIFVSSTTSDRMHPVSSDVVQIYLPSWIKSCLYCCVRSHFSYLCKERKCRSHWFRQPESIWHWINVMYFTRYQASSMKSMRTVLFWVIV